MGIYSWRFVILASAFWNDLLVQGGFLRDAFFLFFLIVLLWTWLRSQRRGSAQALMDTIFFDTVLG